MERKLITEKSEQVKIIRSGRKTLSLEISSEGEVVVRAPRRTSEKTIREFVRSKAAWIEKHLEKVRAAKSAAADAGGFTPDEIRAMADKALELVSARAEYYANILGVKYGKVTVRNQRTRWGSCSSKGNLNFNCLLALAPSEVLDSVVVHELCHLKEMNHSEKFYAEVLRVFPDYFRCHKWLKENGGALLARMNLIKS